MWKRRGVALFLTLVMMMIMPMSAFADSSDTGAGRVRDEA